MLQSSRAGRTQRGNILFLILLAVVLFAALSYAVTQSMRGGGNDINDESVRLIASEILQTSSSLEQSILRLRLINGCRDNQISFDNQIIPSAYENPNAPISLKCHVFESAGANMVWPVVPSALREDSSWLMTGLTCVNDVGTGGTPGCHTFGESSADLVLVLRDVPQEVCVEINENVGVYNPDNIPPKETNNAFFSAFNGSYANNDLAEIGGFSGEAIHLNGKLTGCFEGAGPSSFPPEDTYNFYHVLIAR